MKSEQRAQGMIGRREFLAGAVASPFFSIKASSQAKLAIGDMHFHSFFGESKYHSRPLAKTLADAGVTLVAWSLVGDLLWFDTKKYKQDKTPKPGETLGWFERELGRVKAHVAEQNLKIAKAPTDIEAAVLGKPHVVLAVEGANFVERDPGRLKAAYDLGVRHFQLVHYTQNTLADIQTDASQHGGLSDIGKQVVKECNRLGILIDLAHCSDAAARDVLAITRAPVVWSHGSVSRGPAVSESSMIWRRRQLSLATAKEIASKGGVVGLWALAPDVGKTVEDYGNRLLQLADWLGDDHVAFGTDFNGLSTYGVLSNYAELGHIVQRWRQQGVDQAKIRKLAIDNYARVLKAALVPTP